MKTVMKVLTSIVDYTESILNTASNFADVENQRIKLQINYEVGFFQRRG